MKLSLIAGATMMLLCSGGAFAGEANGEPFAFSVPGVTTVTGGMKQAPGAMQNPFPFSAASQTMSLAHYSQAPGAMQNPFPFAMQARVYHIPNSDNPTRTATAQPGNSVSYH